MINIPIENILLLLENRESESAAKLRKEKSLILAEPELSGFLKCARQDHPERLYELQRSYYVSYYWKAEGRRLRLTQIHIEETDETGALIQELVDFNME